MQSISTRGVREAQDVHHDAMLNTSGYLYENRVNMFMELKPFWNKTFERLQKQGWTQNYFMDRNINDFIR
ncbi:MAG: hypothetical protein IPM47_14925 [Sphingobacteriales bacterium]|nr:MAG: hypothetical protein IPM47_14925 [Sphingobacteriales bacterium]